MINFNNYHITENRIGWLHVWNVAPDELRKAVKSYDFVLYEGISDYYHTITYLDTFIGLKELVKRRIQEFQDDFSDDELFENLDSDYWISTINNISNARNTDEMETTLYFLEQETGLVLKTEYPTSAYDYFSDIINLDIWNDGTNGAKYIFQLERI